MKHIAAIIQLSAIMSGIPEAPSSPVDATMRVGTATPLRVAIVTPPRVATTSNTITTPSTVRRMPIIHQRVTRNNISFQILANTNDDNDDDDMVVHSNCRPRAPRPDLLEPLLLTASPTPMPHPPIQHPGVFQKASPMLILMPTVGPLKDTPAVTIHDIRPGRHKRVCPNLHDHTTLVHRHQAGQGPPYLTNQPCSPSSMALHQNHPAMHARQHLHPSYAPRHDA
jgi:hypothetical protein